MGGKGGGGELGLEQAASELERWQRCPTPFLLLQGNLRRLSCKPPEDITAVDLERVLEVTDWRLVEVTGGN